MSGMKFERETSGGEIVIGPFKVLLVGDANVGKTSILKRYLDSDCSTVITECISFNFSFILFNF